MGGSTSASSGVSGGPGTGSGRGTSTENGDSGNGGGSADDDVSESQRQYQLYLEMLAEREEVDPELYIATYNAYLEATLTIEAATDLLEILDDLEHRAVNQLRMDQVREYFTPEAIDARALQYSRFMQRGAENVRDVGAELLSWRHGYGSVETLASTAANVSEQSMEIARIVSQPVVDIVANTREVSQLRGEYHRVRMELRATIDVSRYTATEAARQLNTSFFMQGTTPVYIYVEGD